MANTGSILVIGGLAVAAWGYFQGWFCQFGQQFCPQGAQAQNPRGGYIPPGGTHIYRPHGPGPYGPHTGVVGADPTVPGSHGTLSQLDMPVGYGDYSGYGSDYGFDANVAHISIA